ncbi:hypothetical protein [Spirosoma endbachense]|uniref:Uncharacterized protein n=1 Tax=Spirosoma endbachense TaxID=2666025 RepID=A0A6P1VVG4_9BACT|nr:hypothetical protein [Spirosoma endbachense]QHV95639.1 hypothetical protein GJR95_11765 [Spirosoma endbachense]
MTEKNTDSIFGCFVSVTQPYPDASQEVKDIASEQGHLFRTYIWGEQGICNRLKKLKHTHYGKDLELILFQFYVNPLLVELQNMKEIENYRKKEKAIGIPIIINGENFFSKPEEGRFDFLKEAILQKLDLLTVVVKRKKLDTQVEQLKNDLLENRFSEV